MNGAPAPRLIGLGGPKEHGKDALANFIAEQLGSDAVVIGMSDPLLEALLKIDPLVLVKNEDLVTLPDGSLLSGLMLVSRVVQLAGYVEAKRVPKVRAMLQALGTDVVRQLCEDAWVNEVSRRIRTHQQAGSTVLVTGVRFPNELSMVATLGGETVWVQRPGHPVAAGSDHVSEHALTAGDFDAVVLNDGTLADLEVKSALLVQTH
ncbi:hypothetical protein [Leucobacter sp. cx-169]|uniref:deoxynucleotide monophosphate kinase family protein n=1 Tax=Leucobacter sp. cx-169 TaxID=2770549 RepID=UPI00165E4583|nr:hypothetical protein [Leucobacter sp. cx-169]MBC9927284.1 hypothetical protein [Leucobacter sp. cx-169]